MTLRPYQTTAVEKVEAEFAKGTRSTLLVLATGCGKTIIFSHVAAREVRRGGRVLILAHRGELLEQAIDKLYKATGIRAGLEKAEETAEVDSDEIPYTVVVGSVQSMKSQKRLDRYRPDEFSLVIVDEAHHSLGETYKAVLNHFNHAKLLGVTATPDRGDERSLSGVFETIAFEYSIVEAIRDGYLSPIRAQTIPLRIDISGVAKQAGDYQASGLGAALVPYLHQICREIKQRAADRKTIVFTPLISISREMVDIFKAEGVAEVREVNGESGDRAETLEWFAKSGPGCVLCNSMLLTEGFDEPSCDCICILRATKVRALYCQMVGRGSRLSPGKENLLLLDFLWLTQKHDLCRPACLMSENDDVCEVITRKQEKDAANGEEIVDITEELIQEAESEFTKKTKDTLAKRLEEQSKKKGNLIDPLMYAEQIGAFDLKKEMPSGLDESDRPTLAQVDQLEQLGFACPGSSKAADALLTAYQQRVDNQMASPKQIRWLESQGFKNVSAWTFAQAKKMVNRCIVNHWRVPFGVDPSTYVP